MPHRNSIFFTTPSFVAGILFLNLRPLVDKLFVTHYFSSQEVVLMGTVSLILFIPECIVLSTSYAIQSLTSRFSDQDYNFHYLFSGLFIAIGLLIPLLFALGSYPSFFLHLISINTPIDPASLAFFRLSLLGCFFQCLIFCLRGFYSAYRNNQIFFSVIIISLTINCLLNQFLLSGSGLFQPWGIQAMALSYCIATIFGFLIYCEQLFDDVKRLNPVLPHTSHVLKLLRRGIPLAIHGIIDHIGTTFIFTSTSTLFGLIPLASLHLVSSMQGISPGAGFGLTALTEVTKAHAISRERSRSTALHILLSGCLFLGSIGFLIGLAAHPILALIVPNDTSLQLATVSLVQISFGGLFLHVGCQIMLKILQAIDKPLPGIFINLSFIYGFRIPLLFSMGYFTNISVVTVVLILVLEKLLKLSAMILYWHFSLLEPTVNNISTQKKAHAI